MSLVDIHEKLSSHDEVLEKEAAVEFDKLAEEDAAGRIMARGFMDELHKVAGGIQAIGAGKTVPSGDYRTGAAARGSASQQVLARGPSGGGGTRTVSAGPYRTAGAARRSATKGNLPAGTSRPSAFGRGSSVARSTTRTRANQRDLVNKLNQ